MYIKSMYSDYILVKIDKIKSERWTIHFVKIVKIHFVVLMETDYWSAPVWFGS